MRPETLSNSSGPSIRLQEEISGKASSFIVCSPLEVYSRNSQTEGSRPPYSPLSFMNDTMIYLNHTFGCFRLSADSHDNGAAAAPCLLTGIPAC